MGVQEAHVFPDGQHIIFYGGQRKNTGASGNGQQWWVIPADGGEPQPWSEIGGNAIVGYAVNASGQEIAYAEAGHSSACLSVQHILVTPPAVLGRVAFDLPIPDAIEQNDMASFSVKGFSWAPDDDHIAYALEPYRCPHAGQERQTEPSTIYTWNIRTANAPASPKPAQLVEGSYPVWIR